MTDDNFPGDLDARQSRLLRTALSGGGLAGAVFLATALGVGMAGDREAIQALDSALPTIRFLCSAAIGASATVMALMLTLLGLSQDFDSDIAPDYYRRIQYITTLCVVCLVGGVGLLILLTIPLGETDALSAWYDVFYYVILVAGSALGGLLVAITLTLRIAVNTLVSAVHPEASSSMIQAEDE